jgi:hypothetical protein
MGAPDNELIAEVSLVTEGFTQSKDLASKIVSLFKLSKQLLSSQQHYDWGLRALKAVLNSGGRLIQMYKTQVIFPFDTYIYIYIECICICISTYVNVYTYIYI